MTDEIATPDVVALTIGISGKLINVSAKRGARIEDACEQFGFADVRRGNYEIRGSIRHGRYTYARTMTPDDEIEEDMTVLLLQPVPGRMEFAESVPDFWNRSMRELLANAKHLRPLLIALVLYVLVSALILVGVEGGSYGKAVYLTWITMTTVGYGDFVPSNTLGRVCVSVDAFVGLILISVIVWVVTVSLTKRQ